MGPLIGIGQFRGTRPDASTMRILFVASLCLFLNAGSVVGEEAQGIPATKSILTIFQGFVHGLYEDFVSRQQSIANLLTCGNCVNEGWEAIMTTVAKVPGLEWAIRPESDEHPPNFFTAINNDGVVTGFGGSIINNKPVVEFVFDQNGIIQHLNASRPDLIKQ